MLRRSVQVFFMMLAAAAMLFTAGTGASAGGKSAITAVKPAPVTVTVTGVPQAKSPEVRQINQALQDGRQVVLKSAGGSATLSLSGGRIHVAGVSTEGASALGADGWCASSIATVLFGMGAIAIGALAVASTAAGGAFVAGFWITTGTLYGAAALAASFSALYAFIDSKVCK